MTESVEPVEIDVDELLREIAEFESTTVLFFQDMKEYPGMAEAAISLMQEVARGLGFLRSKIYQCHGIDSDWTE